MKTFNSKFTRRRVLTSAAGVAGGAAVMSVAAPFVARAAETIKLGVLLPFSGGLELFGQQGTQGIGMAVDEANAAGGVLGRQIEIVKADNRTDPKTSVERAAQLIQRDKVHAIIGPVTSAARDAIKSTVERYKTPLLYATDYEGGVCSKTISCYSALPAHYVDPLMPYLQETVGESFYLFGADYVWPQQMNKAIRRVIEGANGTVVGEEYTPFGMKDFATTIRKIEESGAKCVVLTVPGADGITFVKQFTAAGMKSKCRIAFMGFNENYLPGLSDEESNGIIGCSHFIQTLDRPEAHDFVARQKAKFGDDVTVSYYVDSHYGITKFFIEAIRRADSDQKDKIMAALPGQTLTVGNGEVTLRPEDLHVDLNMLIFEAQGGKLNQQKYIGRISAPSQCA
ncbi:substrate-binding protein [Oceanibacterium hippocampi]|uniref:Aliphatic amidase expression-regulating protein n=1 Tax=Oceanibacterium hippocampi TaxID=745714 RepID=A0A1Y5RX48_9PROT|nr:substrate-binding protein [Oceanibacterium hippocampi]SLN27002.1 Aliphatic amidase expression-regulating protein [Oceanibacterium hippocampi]